MSTNLFRSIPQVDFLIRQIIAENKFKDSELLHFITKRELSVFKKNISEISKKCKIDSPDKIISYLNEKIFSAYQNFCTSSIKKVINCTGIILHTNLGRAPISEEHLKKVFQISGNYCNLEFDLETGSRLERSHHLDELFQFLTGAESSLIVNNNAAALFLILNSICTGKEVIISKGHQIEIGGSFRLPEILLSSGAKIKEVGTTNRTHFKDYETAITPETGALLFIHTSNYKIIGFTKEVSLKDLIGLAKKRDLPVIYDAGSGSFFDKADGFFLNEPSVKEAIKDGVDLITISGDKALGGPQAGIICGKEKIINRLKENHLLRALRCDKFTYTLLEDILRCYLFKESTASLLVLKHLKKSRKKLLIKAEQLKNFLECKISPQTAMNYSITVEKELIAQMGSGTLPLQELESSGISILPKKLNADEFSYKLRKQEVPVISYIRDKKIIIDLKAVSEKDFDVLKRMLLRSMNNG